MNDTVLEVSGKDDVGFMKPNNRKKKAPTLKKTKSHFEARLYTDNTLVITQNLNQKLAGSELLKDLREDLLSRNSDITIVRTLVIQGERLLMTCKDLVSADKLKKILDETRKDLSVRFLYKRNPLIRLCRIDKIIDEKELIQDLFHFNSFPKMPEG